MEMQEGERHRKDRSIQAVEDEFISDLHEIADTEASLEYLLEFCEDVRPYPESSRDEAHMIADCTADTWACFDCIDGSVVVFFDSGSLITKGLLGAITDMVDGAPADEVARWNPRFTDDRWIKPHMASGRKKGLEVILGRLREFAQDHCGSALPQNLL